MKRINLFDFITLKTMCKNEDPNVLSVCDLPHNFGSETTSLVCLTRFKAHLNPFMLNLPRKLSLYGKRAK